MACTSPISVKIKYKDQSPTARKERIMKGENPDAFIGFVPCGKCYGCLSYRRNQWTFRIQQEAYYSVKTYFCTFTYSDEFKPVDGVSKKYLQKLCKYLKDKCNIKFTYYGIGEYGTETQRPHYHLMVFLKENYSIYDIYYYLIRAHSQRVRELNKWTYKQIGNIRIGEMTIARSHYITHYHVRPKNPVEGSNPCFCIMSKGVGNQWFIDKNILDYVRQSDNYNIHDLQGNTFILPPYYRKKYKIEKKECHCSLQHPFIKNKDEFDYFLDLPLERQVQYLQGKQLADKQKLKKYNKQIKINNI